ncbi:hypothetical protein FHL15_005271 [Xylaria flabelliformis]|uniref:Uncharacterized protein n=1 Tax=Xylaria flabelliformis TaxID=2512241 RepID=A0A553I103_9PEZI|nr:hypothetical protein FHL15_005271 [Xylaria flabelliformis]
MEEQPDVEILIHIGAPSRAVDDARYRSLAAAYVAFESVEPVHLCPQSGIDSDIEDSSRHSLAIGEDESSDISWDDRISSLRSPQASFRSAVDNADSPQMRIRKVPNHPFIQQVPAPATQASWETPPSFVQDSQPTYYPECTSLTSPTRALENYCHQYFELSPDSSKHDSQSTMLNTPYRCPSQNQGYRYSSKKLMPCSQQMIPCTPCIRDVTVPPSNCREGSEYQESNSPQQQPEASVADESGDSVIEETKFLLSSSPSGFLRADSEPPPKLRRLDLVTSPHLSRAASDVGPQSLPSNKDRVIVESPPDRGYTYESLEIRPPEPPISELYIEPQDLVTHGLQKLSHDAGTRPGYRPEKQTRQLNPYERGYWLLDCSSWEPQLKRQAWASLANHVGLGVAGWGVWCKRDPSFMELRVFCWGTVVPHIWYVLWLLTQGKVVYTGCSWIDAEGKRVVIMGSRDYPQR